MTKREAADLLSGAKGREVPPFKKNTIIQNYRQLFKEHENFNKYHDKNI